MKNLYYSVRHPDIGFKTITLYNSLKQVVAELDCLPSFITGMSIQEEIYLYLESEGDNKEYNISKLK